MDRNLERYYRKFRAAGNPAASAMRQARTEMEWEKAEGDGLVRLRVVPDEELYDDSYIDTWDDVSLAEKAKARKTLWSTINREGVWGVITEYLGADGHWEHGGSCWGFVGDDWKNSGYDSDLKREALDGLDATRTEQAAELAARATYAAGGAA